MTIVWAEAGVYDYQSLSTFETFHEDAQKLESGKHASDFPEKAAP
jgi:hypothetical protein